MLDIGFGPIAVFVMTLLPSNPAGARYDGVVAKNAAPVWDSQRLGRPASTGCRAVGALRAV